tara:strand:- start:69 stop:461 length:393 start_codon:yes stop_codon:yes gene_type:complete
MPRIGRYWDDHGGIYAGISVGADCDYHVILCDDKNLRDIIYLNAIQWTDALCIRAHGGFKDWKLPTRQQAALLYANLQDQFEDKWYWTRDKYPPDIENCMWVQTFGYGRQADARKTDACRARAVRVEKCE